MMCHHEPMDSPSGLSSWVHGQHIMCVAMDNPHVCHSGSVDSSL